MHYSDKPESVRVDFWKPSGKWYCTEAVIWTGEYKSEDQLIHDSFAKALLDHLTEDGQVGLRLEGMRATCLDPCHEHSHPISLMVDEKELRTLAGESMLGKLKPEAGIEDPSWRSK